MKMKIPVLLVFLSLSPHLRAQDIPSDTLARPSWLSRKWAQVVDLVVGPSKKLDSAYVFQTPLRWTAALEGTAIGEATRFHSNIERTSLLTGDKEIINATLDYNLKSNLYKKVGLSGGYGGLVAGYGIEVGRRGPEHNTFFSLGLTGTFYGIQLKNYVINEYIVGALSSDSFATQELHSEYPARQRTFTVDGFYAVNGRHFAYTAPYNGKILQRRSVGSLMVSGRYVQGELSVDSEDAALLEITGNTGMYTTQQVSMGVGYSYNWVFFHKDPEGPSGFKGVKNLTLNMTVLPMASFYTHIEATAYQEEWGKTRIDGKLALTYVANASLCYSWDRFSVNAQIHHSSFGFHGATSTIWTEGSRVKAVVDTRALFADLTLKCQFFVRF